VQARAIGRDIEEIYRNSNRGILADVDLLQQITEACRDCVREFVRGEQEEPSFLQICVCKTPDDTLPFQISMHFVTMCCCSH
jgi:hypothetical protein